MKDEYFPHNWKLREQELQVRIKGTAVFALKIQQN
jgi:hypothetical protein